MAGLWAVLVMPTMVCAFGCLPVEVATVEEGSDRLWLHNAEKHRGQPATVVAQLAGVTFHEQALLAIKALAIKGEPFTVGHAHPMVEIPAPNPRTDWETARKDAERLGWIEWTGEYADSIVPTTKGSAVKVWRGTYAAKRAAA